MRAGFIYSLLLIFATSLAGPAWAVEKPPQPSVQSAPAAQAAPSVAPGTADLRRDQELLKRDFKHLEKINQERIKSLEKQIALAGDRFSDVIVLLLTIIILASAAAGFTGYFSARKQAEEAVDRWIKSEGEKILKQKADKTQKKIDEMIRDAEREIRKIVRSAREQRDELDEIINGVRNSIGEGERPDISPGDEVEIRRAAQEMETKDPSKRTFKDWELQAFSAYVDQDFEKAANAFDAAANIEDATPAQVAKVLFNKGVMLDRAEKPEEAIAVYDEVVKRFGDSKETALLEQVAKALVNKGGALGQAEKPEEAIAIFDEVVKRFGDSEETALLEQVAGALFNKGVTLGRMEKPEEEIAVYDEVVKRFGDSKETALLEQVAGALVNKGVALGQTEKPKEAIAVYDEVVKRFGDSKETALLEKVAGALNGKAFRLLIMAKAAWQSPENENEARDLLSQALIGANASLKIKPDEPIVLGNKGYTLFLLGREEEAEPILRKALDEGGEKIRDGELEDADIHPLPQDEAFKELINRLWAEVSAEKGKDDDGENGDG